MEVKTLLERGNFFSNFQIVIPFSSVMEPELDVENSKFIISKVGDKFCELVEQEREAKTWAGEDGKHFVERP